MSEFSSQPSLSDNARRYLLMLADALALSIALWVAVVLRYGDLYQDITVFWWQFPLVSVLGVVAFGKLDLYRAIIRYIGPGSMLPVIQGVTIAAIGASFSAYFTGAVSFPRSAPIIFWFVAILLVGGGRVIVRAYFYGIFKDYLVRENVAIYGVDKPGAQLAIALLNGNEYMPVAFIDENPGLRRNTIHGIRVFDSANLEGLVKEFNIRRILLAQANGDGEQRRALLNRLSELPVHINTVPDINELVSGQTDQPQIREIEIADLLGRERVPPDEGLIRRAIHGRNILVTGAAGTIGSELCREILKRAPARLVLYDNSEYGLFQLEQELKSITAEETDLVVLLGSILNPGHLRRVLEMFAVDKLYHAAAYKHVPLVEQNIIEGVRNNVVGTWLVAKAVSESGVHELVMISSDKAVRPTNVMGASKRLAELIIQGFAENAVAEQTGKTFSMVRFGNVLKSSGSVVPLFEEQIREGGPVTVTHPETTRYFMTCGEASELVIQAGEMAEGGEIFVLDMGEPVQIRELAEKMIHLHGKIAGPTKEVAERADVIDIEYIGLRPGEKLVEELVIGEQITGTRHSKIMRAREVSVTWEQLVDFCTRLEDACRTADYAVVRALLEKYVAGYRLADWAVDPGFAKSESASVTSNITRIDDHQH